MAIIIGGPNNPNAYVYQPKDPGNTSVSPSNQSQNNQATYTVTGGPHSSGPRKLKKKIKSTTGTSFGPAGGGIGTFSGQNIQSAAAPTPAEVLQSIVDVKDRTKNIPGIGGLNKYQNLLQDFRTSNPANMAAYAKRFPVAQFAMTALPRVIPGIGSLQTLVQEVFKKGKSKVGDKFSGIMNTDVMKDLAAAPGGFFNDLKTMLGMNKNKKEGATTATENSQLNKIEQDPMRFMDMEDILKGSYEQYGSTAPDLDMFFGKSFDTSPGRYSTFYTPGDDKIQQVLMEKGLASLVKKDNIKPKEKPPMPKSKPMSAYEQAVAEYMNTYGPGSDLFQEQIERDKKEIAAGGAGSFGGMEGLTYDEIPMMDKEYIRNMINIMNNSTDMMSLSGQMPAFYKDRFRGGGYDSFQDVPFRTDNIPADAFSGARSSLIPQAASIIPQTFKDGGSPENYDVLKSINDTMHG